MASDDEDEELKALRLAVLLSMKKNVAKEPSPPPKKIRDEKDLKALRETALATIESASIKPKAPWQPPVSISSVPISSVYANHSFPPPGLNTFNTRPPFLSYQPNLPAFGQPGYGQMSLPPPYIGQPSFGPPPIRQTPIRQPPIRQPPARQPPTRLPSLMSGDYQSRAPPQTSNLIVINPEQANKPKPCSPSRQSGPVNQKAPAEGSVLLRPQDKWCSPNTGSYTATAEPKKQKGSSKFTRYDSNSSSEDSDTSSDESEDEKQASPEKIEKKDSGAGSDSDSDDVEKQIDAILNSPDVKPKTSPPVVLQTKDKCPDLKQKTASIKPEPQNNSSSSGLKSQKEETVPQSKNFEYKPILVQTTTTVTESVKSDCAKIEQRPIPTLIGATKPKVNKKFSNSWSDSDSDSGVRVNKTGKVSKPLKSWSDLGSSDDEKSPVKKKTILQTSSVNVSSVQKSKKDIEKEKEERRRIIEDDLQKTLKALQTIKEKRLKQQGSQPKSASDRSRSPYKSTRKLSQSPRKYSKSPRRRSFSPKTSRSPSPWRRSLSPRRRSPSPRRRPLSPRRHSPISRKQSLSPRRRLRSPRRSSMSPRKHSPNLRKRFSYSRSPSPLTHRNRSLSPRRRQSPGYKRSRSKSGSRGKGSVSPKRRRTPVFKRLGRRSPSPKTRSPGPKTRSPGRRKNSPNSLSAVRSPPRCRSPDKRNTSSRSPNSRRSPDRKNRENRILTSVERQKIEARKRKFEGSNVEVKKTVSLKNISKSSRSNSFQINSPKERISKTTESESEKIGSIKKDKRLSSEFDDQKSDDSQSSVSSVSEDESDSDDEGRSWRKEQNQNKRVARRTITKDNNSDLKRDKVILSSKRSRPSREKRTEDENVKKPKSRKYRSEVNIYSDNVDRGFDATNYRRDTDIVTTDTSSDLVQNKKLFSVVLPSRNSPSDRNTSSPVRRVECSEKTVKPKSRVVSSDSFERTKHKRLVITDEDVPAKKRSKVERVGDARTLLESTKQKTEVPRRAVIRNDGISVTLQDKDDDNNQGSPSKLSVHERLGRKVPSLMSITTDTKYESRPTHSPDSLDKNSRETRKSKDKSSKKSRKTESSGKKSKKIKRSVIRYGSPEEEEGGEDDALEKRIQMIKEKNVAILRRQAEILKDKERFG